MLCKITMRAALAHVLIGIGGVFAASFAGAQYAAELLTDPDTDGFANVKASEAGKIVLKAKLDQLLDTSNQEGAPVYVRMHFGGALLSQGWAANEDPIGFFNYNDHDDDSMTPVERTEVFSGVTQTRVFGGDEGSAVAVYRLRGTTITLPDAGTTYFEVELGNDTVASGETRVIEADATGDGRLAVRLGVGSYTGRLSVYDNQGDARNGTGTAIIPGDPPVLLVTVANQIGAPTVTAFSATADVASEGGPFRRFEAVAAEGEHPGSSANVGLLAKIEIGVTAGLLDPNTGKPAASQLSGATYTVTSVPGNFGFGSDVDNPWMVSSDATCMDGGLTLQVDDDAIAPDADMDPTTAADADTATMTLTHESEPRYFCVLVDTNTATIPVVAGSGPDKNDGYSIAVQPRVGGMDGGVAVEGEDAGSIGRNGTTVNISFLTTHPEYNQRLAIVNRGSEDALFWMDNDNFQTETGTTVMDTTDISGMVPAGGRIIIRIDDHLQLEGIHTRAAGTLNLNAPPVTIDVMTVQFHEGTGTVDTTIYQHN